MSEETTYSLEDFEWVWKDSSVYDILNQFYYEHIDLQKAYKEIEQLQNRIKELEEINKQHQELNSELRRKYERI